MNVLSLFAGIGGLELGLEHAGMHVVGQVEIDPFCRSVLARHWPEVPRHDDVRTSPAWWLAQPRPVVDVVAGGFPCQPFAVSGRRRGIADERWGWPWMADVIRAVRPRFVIVENVPCLIRDADAFGWMLGDLAELGFDAEWGVLPACSVGAPHTRERLLVVAHANGVHGSARLGHRPGGALQDEHGEQSSWAHPVNGLLEADARGRRMADGVSRGLDAPRIKGLGNAVVPAVGELIGRHVLRSVTA